MWRAHTAGRRSARRWVMLGSGLPPAPPEALTAADDVVEGDVHQATVQVDVADLQAAQFAATHPGDHHPGWAGGSWWAAWLTQRGCGREEGPAPSWHQES